MVRKHHWRLPRLLRVARCVQWAEALRTDAIHVVIVYGKASHEDRAILLAERVAKRVLNPISAAMEFFVAGSDIALPFFDSVRADARLPLAIVHSKKHGGVFVTDEEVRRCSCAALGIEGKHTLCCAALRCKHGGSLSTPPISLADCTHDVRPCVRVRSRAWAMHANGARQADLPLSKESLWKFLKAIVLGKRVARSISKTQTEL